MVVGSCIGFILYIVLLKSWGAVKVSPYAFLTPIVVIICDYLLLGESLTKNEYVGMMIIFIAMCFAFYKKEIIAQMFNKRID